MRQGYRHCPTKGSIGAEHAKSACATKLFERLKEQHRHATACAFWRWTRALRHDSAQRPKGNRAAARTSGMRRACVSLARGRSNTAAKEARHARCDLASPEFKENKTTDLRHNV
jgi:hypothetical protein